MRLAWILRRWPWFAVVIGVVGFATYLFPRSPLENIRRRYFDILKLQRTPVVLDDPDLLHEDGKLLVDSSGRARYGTNRSPVALVAVDDATSERYRSATPPRDRIAAALDMLVADGARVIAIDLVLENPDRTAAEVNSVLTRLETIVPDRRKILSGLAREHDPDGALARALKDRPISQIFYGPFSNDEKAIEQGAETIRSFESLVPERWLLGGADRENGVVEACQHLRQPWRVDYSLPQFMEATRWGGNAVLETGGGDGVLRRYLLVSRIGACEECVFASLGFSAARAYRELDPNGDFGGAIWLKCKGAGVDALTLGDGYYVPVTDEGEIELDFTGLFDEVFTNIVPLWKVAEGKFPKGRFTDQLVFIGPVSAFEDTVPTPGSRYNGVGIHMMAAEALIHERVLTRSLRKIKIGGWEYYTSVPLYFIEMIVVLLMCVSVTAFFLYFETSQTPLAVALFLPVGGHVVSKLMLDQGYLLDALTPMTFTMVAVFGCAGLRYAVERQDRLEEAKRRAATERELGRFLSPSVAEIALRQPELLKTAKKEISILFSDIRGFTTTAEGMSPEALVALLSEYLTAMTKIVFVYKGTLDKYIGDAVMALFGAPLDSPEHPELACRTALAMIEELGRLQKDWEARKLPVLQIGIGINTGVVSVGRMGSSVKEEYTCIGDEVNFASRVEGLTKHYGVKILVGENTRVAVGEKFAFRDLGKVKVKGKTKSVRIYELLGTREQIPSNPGWIVVFEKGMDAFQAQRWEEADALFSQVIAERGGEDPPSKSLMMWTGIFRKRPPGDDWDGTIERREK